MSNDRDKALDMALAQIDKQFGKGSIMRMGEKGTMAVEAISTGALSLDLALGIGGLPRGRVTEIYTYPLSGQFLNRRLPPAPSSTHTYTVHLYTYEGTEYSRSTRRGRRQASV